MMDDTADWWGVVDGWVVVTKRNNFKMPYFSIKTNSFGSMFKMILGA